MFYESLPLVPKCTKEPKLFALQFKIIHSITNCKYNQCKWQIADNDICDFCTADKQDDIIHALCECEHTKSVLTEIFKVIDQLNRFLSMMEIEDFLFGVEHSALNVMILLIKKYILEIRTYNLTFSVSYIMHQIYIRIILDKKTMMCDKFTEKWCDFYHLVQQAFIYWESKSNVC